MRLRKLPFLTAAWRHLVVLNFDIEHSALASYVPKGTELDQWQGRTLVSLVGFQFQDLRVCGLPILFHRNFEEVNLRFYVRRKAAGGWRRGVVFIREMAPRPLVNWAARTLYGENYLTVPMSHHVESPNGDPRARHALAYGWRFDRTDYSIALTAGGVAATAAPGTLEEFVIEHYWGYSGGGDRPTIEYRVDHPRWKLWPAHQARFEGDPAKLYGERFAEALGNPPSSAFYADGSPVTVYWGARVTDDRR
ncbi:MAG: DUF2071 domain-containing protein [Planctomycetota bacterium]|nr:MAG: DUF2071 domain-containing protein [Planctomycetota bacterium]